MARAVSAFLLISFFMGLGFGLAIRWSVDLSSGIFFEFCPYQDGYNDGADGDAQAGSIQGDQGDAGLNQGNRDRCLQHDFLDLLFVLRHALFFECCGFFEWDA